MATFKYFVQENVAPGTTLPVISEGGFQTEEDAKAAGEKEAKRIAQSSQRTLSVDVRRVD